MKALQKTTKNKTKSLPLRLIESDDFPIDFLSTLALKESWRKEVHRPVYHVHKWWAKRLGSVFRGIVLGCLLSPNEDFKKAFYQKGDFSGISVFDPFMGSGTTIGEAHKLGCTTIGRDINSVACESVRVAMGPLNREKLLDTFKQLSDGIGEKIRKLYTTEDRYGKPCDVLYFFWVKQTPCPTCKKQIDLFPSYIFAKNAYPNRKPEVQIYCPKCEGIFAGLNHSETARCTDCSNEFNPHKGPAQGSNAFCNVCSKNFSILDAVRETDNTPNHKLYAKLVLTKEGEKQYLRATKKDKLEYDTCSKTLNQGVQDGKIKLPDTNLVDGYNTRQAMGYNYRTWRDFFNDRQLLSLGWLHDEILKIKDHSTRDALLLLFSGVLEFNNLFTSYKGEGTGAVRHMFAHHILKPERMPIEANVWGTPKSSGSFLNLFKSRLIRALDYREEPFEISVNGKDTTIVCSDPFTGDVSIGYPTNGAQNRGIFLSCGSSDKTDLIGKVDLVVTDPPFFDNVHYSELADFFYSWQRLAPRGFIGKSQTTRDKKEVQDKRTADFSKKLRDVFGECNRILKDDGLLVFTYHHSRSEGWSAVAEAVYGAGFTFVNAHPVKSEMSVAAPKTQAKSPIQLDVIFVCRKRVMDLRPIRSPNDATRIAKEETLRKASLLRSIGLELSRNDIRVILYSKFLVALGPMHSTTNIAEMLNQYVADSFTDNIRKEFVESNKPLAT